MGHSIRIFVAAFAVCVGMESLVHADGLAGTYIGSSMYACRYTTSQDGAGVAASQMQSQAVTGFSRFTSDGRLTVEVVSNTYNVVLNTNPPTGTRGTTLALCAGTYWPNADGSYSTDVECIAHPMNPDGSVNEGTTIDVPSIKGRLVKAGNELFRMPLGGPEEETVITTTGPTTTTAWRKCTRTGSLHKTGN